MIEYIAIPEKYDRYKKRMYLQASCDWWIGVENEILVIRLTENRNEQEPVSVPLCRCHFTPHWKRRLRSDGNVRAFMCVKLHHLLKHSDRGYLLESDDIAAFHEVMIDQEQLLTSRGE